MQPDQFLGTVPAAFCFLVLWQGAAGILTKHHFLEYTECIIKNYHFNKQGRKMMKTLAWQPINTRMFRGMYEHIGARRMVL